MSVAIDLHRQRLHLKGGLMQNYIWLRNAWRVSPLLRKHEFPIVVNRMCNVLQVIEIKGHWTVTGEK